MSYSDNDNIGKGENQKEIKKKNRTLQYYKFLFYSMKTEIKLHDFIKLFRTSNVGEISLWIISLILYISTPKDFPKLSLGEKSTSYKNGFIWFHLLHVIRAIIGIYLIYSFPRSHQVITNLESNSDSKLETTLFNDLIRETIFFNVTEKIKPKKILIYIYIILTILNLAIDLIDLSVILCSLSGAKPEAKVVLLSYFMIAVLYSVIDLSYVFWMEQLKYVFPKQYLKPIESLLFGIVDKAMIRFKLKKPNTNIISEEKAQQSNQPYVQNSNDIKNGGINIFENILKDSFGVKNNDNSYNIDEKVKNEKRPQYPQNNLNPPSSEEQIS